VWLTTCAGRCWKLERMVRENSPSGLTSNPSIFHAIVGSSDYDDRRPSFAGPLCQTPKDAYELASDGRRVDPDKTKSSPADEAGLQDEFCRRAAQRAAPSADAPHPGAHPRREQVFLDSALAWGRACAGHRRGHRAKLFFAAAPATTSWWSTAHPRSPPVPAGIPRSCAGRTCSPSSSSSSSCARACRCSAITRACTPSALHAGREWLRSAERVPRTASGRPGMTDHVEPAGRAPGGRHTIGVARHWHFIFDIRSCSTASPTPFLLRTPWVHRLLPEHLSIFLPRLPAPYLPDLHFPAREWLLPLRRRCSS